METSWARLKAHELRDLAQKDAVVILPVASIEQHGPHLPVMTDTRIGEEMARRAAEKAWPKRPTIWTPVMWAGLSEHHMDFGGTLTLTPATFRAVVIDLIDAITRAGFRHILMSNSHGGNIIPCQQILDEISPKIDATVVFATYAMEAGEAFGAPLEDQPNIMHACEAETSMMMVCAPDTVDDSDLAAHNAPYGNGPDFLRAGRSAYRWRPLSHATHNGVLGMPEKSTPEKGEQLLEIGSQALADLITDPDTWADVQDLRGEGTGCVPFGDRT